ncbi:MAG: hypothetical protein JST00_07650 [Deltaproteobacteria bacterium]|nr:hypothetical protein [Deltaproteobacteria bacterium]
MMFHRNEAGVEGSEEAALTGFQTEEATWFATKPRGLTRRPSSVPPSMPEPSSLDDSIFDRWMAVGTIVAPWK